MNLQTLQAKVELVYNNRNYSESVSTLCIGVMEEVGELAEAVLMACCADYIPSAKKVAKWRNVHFKEHIACEVGDVIIYLLAICNVVGIEPQFDDKFKE